MNKWIPWRGPAVLFAMGAMLLVAAVSILIVSGDLNEASDGQATTAALTRAAADIELAWWQVMGADALAATGTAPDEAQGFFDGSLNLYNSSKAVLASAGVAEIDQALAGSDAGMDQMVLAFNETMRLAATGDVEAATDNHLVAAGAIYNNVDPAVEGLMTIAGVADSRLQSSLDSGAGTLRWLSVLGIVIAAAGLAYAGFNSWETYRKVGTTAGASSKSEVSEMSRAA